MLQMNKFNKNLHKAISTSYTLVGSILFFGCLGYLLNKRFNDKNWFIGLLILGAIVGLYETYKQINK